MCEVLVQSPAQKKKMCKVLVDMLCIGFQINKIIAKQGNQPQFIIMNNKTILKIIKYFSFQDDSNQIMQIIYPECLRSKMYLL